MIDSIEIRNILESVMRGVQAEKDGLPALEISRKEVERRLDAVSDHEHDWTLYGVGAGTSDPSVSWGSYAECWCGAIIDRKDLGPVTLYGTPTKIAWGENDNQAVAPAD